MKPNAAIPEIYKKSHQYHIIRDEFYIMTWNNLVMQIQGPHMTGNGRETHLSGISYWKRFQYSEFLTSNVVLKLLFLYLWPIFSSELKQWLLVAITVCECVCVCKEQEGL